MIERTPEEIADEIATRFWDEQEREYWCNYEAIRNAIAAAIRTEREQIKGAARSALDKWAAVQRNAECTARERDYLLSLILSPDASAQVKAAAYAARRAAIEDCARVVDGLVRELEADEWADVLGVKVAAQRIHALAEPKGEDVDADR